MLNGNIVLRWKEYVGKFFLSIMRFGGIKLLNWMVGKKV